MERGGGEGGWKPNVEISPNCPRCGSSNTKFCYYNNYSLTQPRYFCKGCRRYWTKGGSLRNVPVGGGCRKNRRSGKSLRPTIKNFSHYNAYNGCFTNKGIVSATSSSLVEPSTSNSGVSSDGSHIDLALVYANFLNPRQDSHMSAATRTGFELADQFPSEFDSPSLDQFATRISNNPCLEPTSTVQLLPVQENGSCPGTFADHLSSMDQTPLNVDDHHLMYYCGLNSSTHNHKQQDKISNNHGLPPLPGEEVATDDQEFLWSSSHMIMDHDHHTLQQVSTEHVTAIFRSPDHDQTQQDPNVLLGNCWSPFDLSGDDT